MLLGFPAGLILVLGKLLLETQFAYSSLLGCKEEMA